MKRLLTAAVVLPVLLWAVWTPSPWFFLAITTAAVTLGLREFYELSSRVGASPHRAVGHLAGLAVLGCFQFQRIDLITGVITAAALTSAGLQVYRREDFSRALGSLAATVLGVVYVAVLGGYLVGLKVFPGGEGEADLGAKFITLFFALVMMTDTGAYYTGRAVGRHKLAPRISPGKTVEGAVGGFVMAAVSALACRAIFFPELPVLHAVILGLVIGSISQIGDLVESMFKRGAQVKDSGRLFPGHGGMLDRLDSLLFCAPLVYYYAAFFFPRT